MSHLSLLPIKVFNISNQVNVQRAIEAIQTGRMSSMAKAGRRPVPCDNTKHTRCWLSICVLIIYYNTNTYISL
ncbi:hypothetical protein VN97_g7110 [Penicillium thymicola]|uniref:Uncharacterized protein n=1 Tax=Penicillium thymicola TaxID=293382 RepID=A0AAI9X7C5_PENTH|nr:hypothetical protein VN97_g7110 [Penicillium thymicola]